jgi:hypothetical protein
MAGRKVSQAFSHPVAPEPQRIRFQPAAQGKSIGEGSRFEGIVGRDDDNLAFGFVFYAAPSHESS